MNKIIDGIKVMTKGSDINVAIKAIADCILMSEYDEAYKLVESLLMENQ